MFFLHVKIFLHYLFDMLISSGLLSEELGEFGMPSNARGRESSSQSPQMPYSLEAERVILGSILIDSDRNLALVAALRAADFYIEAHRIVYGCVLEMSSCGVPVDLITLVDAIRGSGDLEKCGGPAFLANLTEDVSRGTNIAYYAELVKRKANERRLIHALNDAQLSMLAEGGGPSERSFESVKSAIARIEEGGSTPSQTEIERWHQVNCTNSEEWEGIPAIEWCVEPLIPRGGFGFVGGGPKDGKSPLIIDLCIHMAHAQTAPAGSIRWLDRFTVRGEKVLYVAKEDGLERLKMRWPDINAAYGYTDPPDLTFLPRKLTTMDLTKADHIQYLVNAITQDRFSFIVLDVLSELMPYQDELKESNQIITSLKHIQDEFPVTFCILDHIRKPEQNKSKRGQQEANPFELRSIMRKYGASDYVFMLARTKDRGKLLFHYECKDGDAGEDLFIKRSEFGASGPKHSIVANVDDLAEQSHERGQETRRSIYNSVPEDGSWATPFTIHQTITGTSERTIRRHLNSLVEQAQLEARGTTTSRQYRRIGDQPNHEEPDQGSLYDDPE